MVWMTLFMGCRDELPPEKTDEATDADTDTDADADADADADTDSDADADTDADADADTDTDTIDSSARRWDCSGMDPADEAPLDSMVALTFDDGPDDEVTPQILDLLREFNAPATFFVLGERLDDPANWDVTDEIVADPLFELANHSYDHSDQMNLSMSDVAWQVDTTSALIASFDAELTRFRFPYGSSDCDTADLVRDRDLSVNGWHIDTADWCYAAAGIEGVCTREDYWRVPEEYEDDMLGFIMEQVLRYDGGVILFHDIHQYTADQLEDVLIALVEADMNFVALDDADAFPRLNGGEGYPFPFLGQACQVDVDRCWEIEYEAWCEPVAPFDSSSLDGICTLPCEGYCLDRDGSPTTFCAEVTAGVGQCTSRATGLNDDCDVLPGVEAHFVDRYVGDSSASAATVEACVPDHWL